MAFRVDIRSEFDPKKTHGTFIEHLIRYAAVPDGMEDPEAADSGSSSYPRHWLAQRDIAGAFFFMHTFFTVKLVHMSLSVTSFRTYIYLLAYLLACLLTYFLTYFLIFRFCVCSPLFFISFAARQAAERKRTRRLSVRIARSAALFQKQPGDTEMVERPRKGQSVTLRSVQRSPACPACSRSHMTLDKGLCPSVVWRCIRVLCFLALALTI